MVSQRPIITNKVSHKREALHGEGLNCCLGMGRLGIGLDWIGLNWGSGWRDGQGRREGDWLAMLDAKGFPFGESSGETKVLYSLVPQ